MIHAFVKGINSILSIGLSTQFAKQHTQVTITGTINETTMYSVNIPGGTMGANGVLRITIRWSKSGTAGYWIPRVYLGGVILSNATSLTSTNLQANQIFTISNRNNESSQVGGTPVGAGGLATAIVTASVNTSVDQTLAVTMTLGNVNDTVGLESVMVEVLK